MLSFKLQGDLVEDASIYRSAVVECMEWHPEKKIIAVGWQSGEITTYNHSEEKVHEQRVLFIGPPLPSYAGTKVAHD